MSVWSRIADWILDHGVPIVGLLVVATAFLGYHATQVRTDHTAGSFLASDSDVLRQFERASAVFGESRAILYLVFPGAEPSDPTTLARLDTLTEAVTRMEGVQYALSLANAPYLLREGNAFRTAALYADTLSAEALRARVEGQPYLRGILLSADGTTSSMMVKFEEAFNNSPERIEVVEAIETLAEDLMGEVALAGFPYVRTRYARRIMAEMPLFTVIALIISLLFLYLTFRAWRAVLLPTLVVGMGLAWTFGLVALFGHRLNIVLSVLPPLIVIIGMANTIHLSTKYFDRYQLLRDRRTAVVQTISTVGLATFLTSLTTAIGFFVLVFSGSHKLEVFGEFAALGIMVLYLLSITIIPIAFLHTRPPNTERTALATHDAFADVFERLATFTERRSVPILIGGAVLIVLGIVGAARVSSDIYVFSDFGQRDRLRRDLAVFEDTFGGLLPMEVVIASEREGQFRSLGNLRRLDALQTQLADLEPVGRALSAVSLVKLSNQAYFGGSPATYRLPSSYEMPFLQAALTGLLTEGDASGRLSNFPPFIDSTFTITRIYLGVDDIGTTQMNALADSVLARAEAAFPTDRFEVFITGTAITATRSGENLVRNLIVSLAVALVVISALMALLFRSARLTIISLVPNLVPLLVVGGAMGFGGILLKPSTALIFPLAFGIAVDDTIHFLAKYRIVRATQPRDQAIITTLRETGKAILFTSLILMSGFLIFTFSTFAGTFNMGALTALTLAVALLTNLLLLPALLYRFGPDDRPVSENEAVLEEG